MRRSERFKGQEDTNRTELAMKRAELKNNISGTSAALAPTVLNSDSSCLISMDKQLGVLVSQSG